MMYDILQIRWIWLRKNVTVVKIWSVSGADRNLENVYASVEM